MVKLRCTGRGSFPKGTDVGLVGRMNPGDERAVPLDVAQGLLESFPNDFEIVGETKVEPPKPEEPVVEPVAEKPAKKKRGRPARKKPFLGFDK